MHPNPKRILPFVALVVLGGLTLWYFFGNPQAAAETGAVTASGTIEAVQVKLGPETGGRAVAVNAREGDPVEAGTVLVQLDTALLEAQRVQAEAAARAAQAAYEAAQANHAVASANLALLQAGPSAEQLAVAQTVIDRAQIAADAAQQAYADLPAAAQETANGQALKTQWDTAVANLENAQAQYALLAAGARPEQLTAAQAQVDAAQAQMAVTRAQAAAATAALDILTVQQSKLTLSAPTAGVVLVRAIEPGEVASPGAVLFVIADLKQLEITVYVPEDRYGQIALGQTAQVTVDSFAGQTFAATVVHIADQAEFTPRNVQTSEGRKTTVFAIRLRVDNPENKLKPGMPADVKFGE